jgi:hypothetical protein
LFLAGLNPSSLYAPRSGARKFLAPLLGSAISRHQNSHTAAVGVFFRDAAPDFFSTSCSLRHLEYVAGRDAVDRSVGEVSHCRCATEGGRQCEHVGPHATPGGRQA